MLGASESEFDFGAHGGEQLACGLDVADLRNIFEDAVLIGQERGRHARESGVLGAADADCPQQGLAAADY